MGKILFTYEMEIEDNYPEFKEEDILQLREEIFELLRPSNLASWMDLLSYVKYRERHEENDLEVDC